MSLLLYPILLICLIVLPFVLSGPFYVHTLILTMVNVVLASSMRLISLSGQMSLAHGGMVTIGAYTSALLMLKLGFDSWVAFLCGGIFAGVFAMLIGIPFMRLKGVYFALSTIFLSEMIVLTAQQWESLTGGSGGIYNIPRPHPVPFFDFASKRDFYFLALLLMVVSLVVIYAIEKSRVGLTLKAIKQSDTMSESIGVNTAWYKVMIFAAGCFFAGLAGAFHSQYISAISPDGFAFLFTIYVLIYVVVGGQQTFIGPILGAVVLTLLPEATRAFKEYVPFIVAAVLIVVIFFMPDGLAGIPARIKNAVRR